MSFMAIALAFVAGMLFVIIIDDDPQGREGWLTAGLCGVLIIGSIACAMAS